MASDASTPLALPAGSSEATSGVATFMSKVWKIVEKSEYNHLISWSDTGKTFIVYDYPCFARDILPLYFKHSNFNSFVRQLNLYGFRKVAKPDQGSLAKAQANEPVEFWHTNFRRGHPELLHLVQRRSVVNRVVTEENSSQISKVMSDIHQMKGRQENIASMIEVMKQDNQHLRRELTLLKDKHIRQQRVLNKIIQFLVHMVYKGKLSGGRRRSSRLMLMDAESQPSPPKRMRNLSDSPTGIDIADITYNVESPASTVPSVNTIQSPLLQSTSPLQSMPAMQSPPTSPKLSSGFPLSVAGSQFPLGLVTVSSPSSAPILVTSSASTTPSPQPLEFFPDSETSLQLPGDLLTEFHLSPLPSSLICAIPPERLALPNHLDHQQQGLEAFPELFSDQLSVDPAIISDFISTENMPVPEYDIIDTARLLESLANDSGADVSHESTFQSNALVPFSTAQLLSSVGGDTDSSLQQLLEGLPPNSEAGTV